MSIFDRSEEFPNEQVEIVMLSILTLNEVISLF